MLGQEIVYNKALIKTSISGESIECSRIRDLQFDMGFLRFPYIFYQNLMRFGRRNVIKLGKIKRQSGVGKPVCLRCLKAFMIDQASNYGFETEKLKSISEFVDCEIGHNGFYEDNGQLIRINHNLK